MVKQMAMLPKFCAKPGLVKFIDLLEQDTKRQDFVIDSFDVKEPSVELFLK